MNNKEFLAELARKTGMTSRMISHHASGLVAELASMLEDESSVNINNFGVFEVKKRLERVIVNPTTQQRMLVPPKLVVGFKPSQSLKSKI